MTFNTIHSTLLVKLINQLKTVQGTNCNSTQLDNRIGFEFFGQRQQSSRSTIKQFCRLQSEMNFSQAIPRVIKGHLKAVRNNMLSIERPSSQSDFSCGWHLSAKDSSALICRCGTCRVKLLVQFKAHCTVESSVYFSGVVAWQCANKYSIMTLSHGSLS